MFSGVQQGIEVREVHLDPPGPGEVEVVIAAAGVCHSDLHVLKGEWDANLPMVLGHEGSGVVSQLGAGVSDLEVGDHVVLSWVPSCGQCRYCLAGKPAQCVKAATVVAAQGVLFDGTSRIHDARGPIFHYLGVSSFAERAVVSASGAIKIRSDAPLELMSLVGCAISTGIGAVQRTARIESGSVVAVIGCGGVGLSCIQGARLSGASKIIAIDVLDEKLELARRLGATDVINSATIDLWSALGAKAPEGIDYVFDAIGKISTTEQAIEMLGQGGAAVIVGLPPKDSTARFNPLSLAEGDKRIMGSNYGSIDPHVDIPRIVDLIMDGQVDVESMVSARRPLDEAAMALNDLAAGHALRQLLIPNM